LAAISVFFAGTPILGQLNHFGTNSKQKPVTYYTLTAYAYHDFVRESGLGIQHQLGANWSVDYSLFYIHRNLGLKNIIQQWDYYDFTGGGFSIKPKWHLTKAGGFYVGATYSLEYIEHGIIPVEYYSGRGSDLYYDYDKCSGRASTVGLLIGSRSWIKAVAIEHFFVIGATVASIQRTTYSTTAGYPHKNQNYPSTVNTGGTYFNLNFGIKIGIGCKKSKKHQAMDAKFDEVYTPRYKALKAYMSSVDFERLANPRPMDKAYKMLLKTDKVFLKIHKWNYIDTTRMYQKFEKYFDEIDGLIEQGKR
jgi:hypothetical protein